jgi:TIR domain
MMKNVRVTTLLQRVADVIFGYDFFISYTWHDGSDYAHDVFKRLKSSGFTVFLDKQDYARGDNWSLLGRRAVRKTRQLILIATPSIHQSRAVAEEVQTFHATGRRIVPIEIGDALSAVRLSASPLEPFLPPELLRIQESLANGAIPHEARPEVLSELERGFTHLRQEQKRTRILLGTSCVLLALLGLSAFGLISANQNAARALENLKAEQTAKLQERRTLSSSYVQTADQFLHSNSADLALAYVNSAMKLTPDDGSIREHLRWLVNGRAWPLRLSPDTEVATEGRKEPTLFSFSASGKTVCAVHDHSARLFTLGSKVQETRIELPEQSSLHEFYDGFLPFAQGASALFNVTTDDLGVLIRKDGDRLAAQFYERGTEDWRLAEKVFLPLTAQSEAPVYLSSRDGSVICISAVKELSKNGDEDNEGPREFIAIDTRMRRVVGQSIVLNANADRLQLSPTGPSLLLFEHGEKPNALRLDFRTGKITRLWTAPANAIPGSDQQPESDSEHLPDPVWKNFESFDCSDDLTQLLGTTNDGLVVVDLTGKSPTIFLPWKELPFITGELVKGQFVVGGRLIMLCEQTKGESFWAGLASNITVNRPVAAATNTLVWFYDLKNKKVVSEPIRGFNAKLSEYRNTADRGKFSAQAFADTAGNITVLSVVSPNVSFWKLDQGKPEPMPITELISSTAPNQTQVVQRCSPRGSALVCKPEPNPDRALRIYHINEHTFTTCIVPDEYFTEIHADLIDENHLRLLNLEKPNEIKLLVYKRNGQSSINYRISATTLIDEAVADEKYFALFTNRDGQNGRDILGLAEAVPPSAEELFGSRAPYELDVWDIRSGQKIFTKSFSAYKQTKMAVDPRGDGFALLYFEEPTDDFFKASATIERYVWNHGTFELAYKADAGKAIASVQFSPISRRLFLSSARGELSEVDAGGHLTTRIAGLSNAPDPIVFSPDEQFMACGLNDSAQVFDAKTFQPFSSLLKHPAPVHDIAFVARSQALAVRYQYKGYTNAIKFWDMRRALVLGEIDLGGWGGIMAWNEESQSLLYRVGQGPLLITSFNDLPQSVRNLSDLAVCLSGYEINNAGALEPRSNTWRFPLTNAGTPGESDYARWLYWRLQPRVGRHVVFGFNNFPLVKSKKKRESWLDDVADVIDNPRQ